MSQLDVAAALKVSQQSIEKFENGHVSKPHYIYDAAKLFKVNLNWLLNGDGHPDDVSKYNDDLYQEYVENRDAFLAFKRKRDALLDQRHRLDEEIRLLGLDEDYTLHDVAGAPKRTAMTPQQFDYLQKRERGEI